jgi:hypothetical protein
MKALIALVLLGLVASAFSDSCGNLQRLKVKQQWSEAFGEVRDREGFALALWKAVFNQEPAARDLFKRVKGDDVHSPEFIAHMMRVLGGLDMCISLLDDEAVLNAELSHLNAQHKERGITSNYFLVFKRALMQTVPAALGRCFDKKSWSACFDVISDGIRKYD